MNLILIYGPPAAGKLTIARVLSGLTDYKLVDNHFFNNISQIFPFEDTKLNKIRGHLSSRFRVELAGEAATAGVNLVFTMAVRFPDSFDFIHDLTVSVTPRGGRVLLVQLHPTLETILNRVENPSRRGAKYATKESLLAGLKAFPGQFDKFPDTPHLTIDNSDLMPNEVAHQIITHYKILVPSQTELNQV